eukprot:gene11086-12349_t
MPRISVGVRIRPDLLGSEPRMEAFRTAEESKTVTFEVSGATHSFTFDDIFSEDSQQRAVFQASALPIVEAAVDGYNGTVFAYGQTGAGKTHTMCGALDRSVEDYGVVGFTVHHLFELAARLPDSVATLSFRFSVLEIYNETLIDLLSVDSHATTLPPTPTATSNSVVPSAKLSIIETESGVIVPGLCLMPISYAQEALDLVANALATRAVAEHQLNQRSSRSHLIYTCYITRSKTSGKRGEPEVHQSKLHLVDLAGSERTDKTKSSGTVQKEANYINRSLSYLEQVVVALTQTKRDHIPYRQSKLTYLLKDSLGGNGNTYLIACIWPKRDHAWETLSTLRLAARMKAIEMHPVRNRLVAKEQAPSRVLQAQLDLLRKELAMRDSIRGDEVYLPEMTKAQRNQSGRMLLDYIIGEPAVREASSLGGSPVEAIASALPVRSLSQSYLMIHWLSKALWQSCGNDEDKVKAVLQQTVVGVAVDESNNTHNSNNDTAVTQSQDTQVKEAENEGEGQEEDEGSEEDRRALFDHFCQNAGAQYYQAYEQAKETLQGAKTRQREIITLLNETKATIDRLRAAIEEGGKEDVAMVKVEEEEKEAKQRYRIAHRELVLCREQIAETQTLQSRAMTTLLNAFQDYHQAQLGGGGVGKIRAD